MQCYVDFYHVHLILPGHQPLTYGHIIEARVNSCLRVSGRLAVELAELLEVVQCEVVSRLSELEHCTRKQS